MADSILIESTIARVRCYTDGKTLQQHVHGVTQRDTTCYTDEWRGDNRLKHIRPTVCHGQKEEACDDDGGGIREVHTKTPQACERRCTIFCVR